MAIFEDRKCNKVVLDDSQYLTCTITASENVQGHTIYIMRVQRGPFVENSWQISRRYSDFDSLNTALQISGIDLPLPPKKVFGKMEREFVAERQQGLQNYINSILAYPLLSSSVAVKRFLDPVNYSLNYLETALQLVSMIFRSEPQWEIVEPLLDIGCRIRKQYFLVRPVTDPKQKLILSWIQFGPEKYLEDKDLLTALKLISNIQHPYIYPVTFACSSEHGALIIRNFEQCGTLRDYLCKVKPKGPALKKYGKPKTYSPLEPHKIKIYGRQILMALKFLHEKGFPHGHLHSGNVVLEDNVCRLLELENQLLGVPSYLRPFFVQVKKVQTLQNVDVYCFGHLLYEMTFGRPCHTSTCDSFPLSCPAELRSVLEATLTKEACKNGLPSLSDLLSHPFFSVPVPGTEEKGSLRVPSQLKETLKKIKEQVERNLREEQKAIRHSQRLSKAQAQLIFGEDKKKRLNERKKQQKLNIESPTSYQNGSTSIPTPLGPT